VNEAKSQSASEITAMRNQVSEVHHQAQSHVHSVERRAHDLIQDLQLKHQSEMDQMQAVAHDAHRIAQERLNQAMNENASLMQTIHDQSVQLRFQKDEQREMRSVILGLQEQVDLLRTSSQPQPQNGAVNDSE
jgi:predicted transcriptional regulator